MSVSSQASQPGYSTALGLDTLPRHLTVRLSFFFKELMITQDSKNILMNVLEPTGGQAIRMFSSMRPFGWPEIKILSNIQLIWCL